MPFTNDRKILLIKTVHSVIFWVMSASVVYFVYAAVAQPQGWHPYLALGLICAEGVALLLNRGRCPLTTLVQRYGTEKGSVTDIFLPAWAADRVFPVCTTIFVIALVVFIINRLLS